MLALFGLAWLCLATVDVVHSAGSDSSIMVGDVEAELVFNMTDNMAAATVYGMNSSFFSEVTLAFEEKISMAKEMFSQIDTSSVSVSYLKGLEQFVEKGYIHPYEEVTSEDMDLAVSEHIEQKFNLDGYEGIPNIIYLMVDDIGWNDMDIGPLESSMYDGAFPASRRLIKDEGITLTNHISAAYCSPARTQFLTGKYSSLLRMDSGVGQMHVQEATIAQEMKSAGYYTAHIGKWGVGWTSDLHTPMKRGFDQSFGFLGNQAHKFTKTIDTMDQEELLEKGYMGSFVDLWDNGNFAGFEEKYFMNGDMSREVESYLPFIFMDKFDEFIDQEVAKREEGGKEPFFLYFASDLAHMPYVSPQYYLERCMHYEALQSTDGANSVFDAVNKCAMLTILDETMANITCKLESAGLADNTLIVFASDNGGDLPGDNYPYLGGKFWEIQGGIKTPAAILGNLVPGAMRGREYDNLFHNTDWLPTLMHAATKGEWRHSILGEQNVINGVSHWDALMNGLDDRPRETIVTYVDADGRMSIVAYHEDSIVQYTKGLDSIFPSPPAISAELTGEPSYSCADMMSLIGVGGAVEGARMFLRTSNSITGGSPDAFIRVRLPMAVFVAVVALAVGALARNNRATKETALLRGHSTPMYGAFMEENQ